jgi:hypothetical protein
MIIGMSSANKTERARKAWRFIRGYRFELGLAATVILLFWTASAMPIWVSVALLAALVGVAIWRRDEILPRTHEMLRGSRVRRQLRSAARDSGFGELYVDRVALTLPGEWADVRVPRGATVASLEKSALAMAGCLRVGDVHVIPDRDDRSRAGLSIIRRNSFLDMHDAEWPLLHAETVDIRKGIPFGLDQYGRTFNARLLSRNLMFGGAPDSGKSSALRIPAAAAALDPKAKLWMMDAKTGGAEFVHWAPAAHRLVRGRDLDAAVAMLAELEQRIEDRGREIVARGEVFVCEDMELDVLMIDELPQFMRPREDDSKDDQSAVKTIRNGIWKLISLGRWAGMITILSAQKPTADVVPSESRDLVDHRFALHCNTLPMSKAILGDDAGEQPVSATEIPSGQPGVGYYMGDHGVQKIRSFFISPKQALQVAERVGQRQLDEDLSTLTA